LSWWSRRRAEEEEEEEEGRCVAHPGAPAATPTTTTTMAGINTLTRIKQVGFLRRNFPPVSSPGAIGPAKRCAET
jgi:hypothetical protein